MHEVLDLDLQGGARAGGPDLGRDLALVADKWVCPGTSGKIKVGQWEYPNSP